MSEKEYYVWRLFYPLTLNDADTQSEKNTLITPFTLNTKLNMLSIINEKHSHQSSSIDLYYPLENTDVCLKIYDIEKLNNFKIEIEIRNRHKEQQSSSLIQHWSIYEIKHSRIDLPDKILNRLDQITIEKLTKYLQIIINDENFLNRSDLSFIKIQKNITRWQMDDSDREIEESDICLLINNNKNDSFYIPTYWRTISIQTGDYDKLLKTLITLQIEDDKDLLDYFTYLISQTHFNSFSIQYQQQQQQLISTLSSEKIYMNLLTMSYASFIELIQHIYVNQI
ncbi:unnamed protein product [Adineta steineri]|uniref:Uncharacterized protein n=1 Tax=Adineta steineri TaxID=433720 RepID=A0A814NLL8_9BILA|nr:unnamed protein product [Adineta steineri]CAF1093733.1 unnamed protein product [Adineta steineri]